MCGLFFPRQTCVSIRSVGARGPGAPSWPLCSEFGNASRFPFIARQWLGQTSSGAGHSSFSTLQLSVIFLYGGASCSCVRGGSEALPTTGICLREVISAHREARHIRRSLGQRMFFEGTSSPENPVVSHSLPPLGGISFCAGIHSSRTCSPEEEDAKHNRFSGGTSPWPGGSTSCV